MLTRAMGPYKFIEYLGERSVTATIADARGKRSRVSVANLLPLRPEADPAWVVRISEQPRVRGEEPEPGVVFQDANYDVDSSVDSGSSIGEEVVDGLGTDK